MRLLLFFNCRLLFIRIVQEGLTSEELDLVKRYVFIYPMYQIGIVPAYNLHILWVIDVSQVYFESDEVYACIVTCGGLCPGLNTVIREIVYSLYYMYGVKRVLGIDVSNSSNPFLQYFMKFIFHHYFTDLLGHYRVKGFLLEIVVMQCI